MVDGVRRAQVADEVGLGARLGGGDDLGAMGDGELDRVGADATGRAGHQHSLAGGGGQGVDGVQRGGATLPISSMTTAVKSSRSVRLVLPASTCARIPKFNVRTTRHVLKIGGNSLLDEHERSAHFPLLGRPAVAGSGADGHPRRATDLLGGAAATYPTQPASWRFTQVPNEANLSDRPSGRARPSTRHRRRSWRGCRGCCPTEPVPAVAIVPVATGLYLLRAHLRRTLSPVRSALPERIRPGRGCHAVQSSSITARAGSGTVVADLVHRSPGLALSL